MHIKHFFLSALIIALICFTSCGTKQPQRQPHPLPAESVIPLEKAVPETAPPVTQTISVTGVGDIMLGTNFPSSEHLPPFDGKALLTDISHLLTGSDIVFGNLEGSFLNEGKCYKACSDPAKCYAFRMPEHYIHHLKDAGFNLLSIANNHIGDFGLPGREKTIEILTQNKIDFAGVDTHPSTVFIKNGIKYGFCAFAPNFGTPDLRDSKKACETIRELSSTCDIVIVSFHGGAEGAENRHVTRDVEFFYGENRGNIYDFSHKAIDAGADIIFGHGPHITRAVELYKDRFIAYSMGNFCTYGRFNLRGLNGVAPIIRLSVDEDGRFVSGKIIPILQEYKKGPAVDKTGLAIKEMIELTSEDFPETDLMINENGIISRKKYHTPDKALIRP